MKIEIEISEENFKILKDVCVNEMLEESVEKVLERELKDVNWFIERMSWKNW